MYTQIAIKNTRYNSTESGTSSYELIDDRHAIVRHLRNEQRHATFNVEMLVGFEEAYIYTQNGSPNSIETDITSLAPATSKIFHRNTQTGTCLILVKEKNFTTDSKASAAKPL